MDIPASILIIDDEESMRAGCMQTLEEEGCKVKAAANGQAGLDLFSEQAFDLVILDLRMPGLDGLEVLKRLRETDPKAVVLVITGYATIESAVDAIRLGAYDFLPKPFSPETLVEIVTRGLDKRRISLENTCLRLELDERMGPGSIIGRSPAMTRVAEVLEKVAPTDSTVLISGETGVGKELVATAIHRRSPRCNKPLVVVDCGALVETLFESELFGHVKGAFTGAGETKYGKFELANGGTIFLDEIGNIGGNIQAKLLRAIQEKEVTKVGSSQKVNVDVRIIAATNKDLTREMREGTFREDLFYRLSVVVIDIPPLRERRQDIPLLVRHFLQKYSQKRKRDVTDISAEAMQSLQSYDWPGNVRELENCIERAIVMAENTIIQSDDLLYYGRPDDPETDTEGKGRLAEMEKEEILKALEQFAGNKSRAAEYLGINRKTLREKIRKYRIADGSS